MRRVTLWLFAVVTSVFLSGSLAWAGPLDWPEVKEFDGGVTVEGYPEIATEGLGRGPEINDLHDAIPLCHGQINCHR